MTACVCGHSIEDHDPWPGCDADEGCDCIHYEADEEEEEEDE